MTVVRIRLTERILTGQPRVDREAGVLRRVKVLGFESANGRRYTREALEKAKHLYEGIVIRIDHPAKAGENRETITTFGRLKGITVEADGMWAEELQFLKEHPAAGLICEIATRMPEKLGLSHNASGEGQTRDGIFIVEEITEVHSVDIVTEPATTNGFFESKKGKAMKRTYRQFFEALKAGSKKRAAKFAKSFLEEADGIIGDELMDSEMADDKYITKEENGSTVTDTGADSGDYKKHLMNAITALLTSSDPEDHKTIDKIMKLLRPAPEPKLAEGEDDNEDDKGKGKVDEETDIEGAGPENGDKTGKSSGGTEEPPSEKGRAVEQRVHKLERELLARKLCAAADIKADDVLMESLVHSPTENHMRRLIDREKKRETDKSNAGRRPRTSTPGATRETTGEGKRLYEAILGRGLPN